MGGERVNRKDDGYPLGSLVQHLCRLAEELLDYVGNGWSALTHQVDG